MQNGFILALHPLYQDEKEIEQFSMESVYLPKKGKIASYNQLTEATAQDVIRVVMAELV